MCFQYLALYEVSFVEVPMPKYRYTSLAYEHPWHEPLGGSEAKAYKMDLENSQEAMAERQRPASPVTS